VGVSALTLHKGERNKKMPSEGRCGGRVVNGTTGSAYDPIVGDAHRERENSHT